MFRDKRMTADEFLTEMITEGTLTVPAGELRNLLIAKREAERKNKLLQEKYELLMLRNVSLKQEIVEVKTSQLEVVGIDIVV